MIIKENMFREVMKALDDLSLVSPLDALLEKFPSVPDEVLRGIISTRMTRLMKSTNYKHKNRSQQYFSIYLKALEDKEKPGILLRMADQFQLSPCLLARFILEADGENRKEMIQSKVLLADTEPNQKVDDISAELALNSSKLLKSTDLIEDKNLAYEIYLCTVFDEEYSPTANVIKRRVGIQHEELLQRELERLNISFLTEETLKSKGYDKTPDFLLDVPIAVDGQVVCWIESKASFGDPHSHRQNLQGQLTSYWNRYGRGLVIYWMGYVDVIESTTPEGILIRDHFPKDILLFEPAAPSTCSYEPNSSPETETEPSAVSTQPVPSTASTSS